MLNTIQILYWTIRAAHIWGQIRTGCEYRPDRVLDYPGIGPIRLSVTATVDSCPDRDVMAFHLFSVFFFFFLIFRAPQVAFALHLFGFLSYFSELL